MTYSIVARDPASGRFGVAIQSCWPFVGAGCPWVESGVGAVVTQSFTEVAHGPNGLARLRAGASAPDALAALLAPLALERRRAARAEHFRRSDRPRDGLLEIDVDRALVRFEGHAVQGVEQLAVPDLVGSGDLELEDEERDRDRHDPVAECLDTVRRRQATVAKVVSVGRGSASPRPNGLTHPGRFTIGVRRAPSRSIRRTTSSPGSR